MASIFKPIKQKKLSEEIVEQIKARIIEGQLRPGEKIPAERDLSTMLGVSRPSVREAIMALEAMGFLEVRRGGGTYVRSITEGSLSPLSKMVEENPKLLEELVEVRIGIEGWSAYLAASRATEEELAGIKHCVDAMQEQAESGGWQFSVDSRFHYAIASAAHNTMQIHMLDTIQQLFLASIEVALTKLYSEPEYISVLVQQHKNIYNGIASRDGEAARQAMSEHLIWVQNTLPRLP